MLFPGGLLMGRSAAVLALEMISAQHASVTRVPNVVSYNFTPLESLRGHHSSIPAEVIRKFTANI